MKTCALLLLLLLFSPGVNFIAALDFDGDLPPVEDINTLEKALAQYREDLEQDAMLSLLNKTTPYWGVFRLKLPEGSAECKQLRSIRKNIRSMVSTIGNTLEKRKDPEVQKLTAYYYASTGNPEWIGMCPAWDELIKNMADPEQRTETFKKYATGSCFEQALLRSCMEDLTDAPQLRIQVPKTSMQVGELFKYRYSIEPWQAVWLSSDVLNGPQPDFQKGQCQVTIRRTSGGRRRAIGRSGGSGSGGDAFDYSRLFRRGGRESLHQRIYSSDVPGILRLSWQGRASDSTRVSMRRRLPGQPYAHWKINTARYKGVDSIEVPVLPRPDHKQNEEAGLRLALTSTAPLGRDLESGFPLLPVELQLAQATKTGVLNIEYLSEAGFWIILLDENGALVGYRNGSVCGHIQSTDIENHFTILEPGHKEKVSAELALPWQVAPGDYQVVIGFGPFKYCREDPPEDFYWQGALISPFTKIKIGEEDPAVPVPLAAIK